MFATATLLTNKFPLVEGIVVQRELTVVAFKLNPLTQIAPLTQSELLVHTEPMATVPAVVDPLPGALFEDKRIGSKGVLESSSFFEGLQFMYQITTKIEINVFI